MAKEVLSVRVQRCIKLWVERKAEELETNESWIVEQALIEQAQGELPPDFDPSKPERKKR